jgi:predicted nucleotidyltransferase component of viral defense system
VNKAILQKLSSELKIAPERILREYWELTLLNELSTESWSASLGFKGGTALRLAYGSPRFSDDLDFSFIGRLNASKVFTWAKEVKKKFNIEITDEVEKRNTILIEFRIRDDLLIQPMKQKIEISKRFNQKETQNYELRLLTSPLTNVQVLFQVSSLEMVWADKISALKERKEPRDLFDLWYVCQKLKRQLPDDLPTISSKTLKLTLNKYLPLNYQQIIQELASR